MHHVYLIPGFFGFANLGQVKYFRAVRETLERHFQARGEEVEIHGVKTFPTGSLRRRARRLLETIVEFESIDRAEHIHLVGHSTGGIDARLLASLTRDLGHDAERARLNEKLRTVVSVASPHYGTPLANFFTTLYGKKLLYFITLLVFVGLWRRPVSAAAGLLGLGFRVTDVLGLNEGMLRQITNQLLRDFTREREAEVRLFLESILTDVSLMVQLTPESMDVLNPAIEPLPGIRYVSYATVSPPPLLAIKRSRWKELLTPLEAVLYSTLYFITARPEPGFRYHLPIDPIEAVTGRPLPFGLDETSNDGVVPTLSMIHGEFRGFVRADHLDVCGHYLRGPLEKRDGADWFLSGAHYDLDQFERLWGDVTDVMLRRQ
ncbi:MAG: triacylglycerol lipase [Deltaproteobacteria bacterium]|nr:triacylglycerol lipase [Deltaproteobacteria bacterium]